MNKKSLNETARHLVAPCKGILAADQSVGTAGKRLAVIGVANTEENRRRYRQMLFTTPGIGQYISGIILHNETVFQKTDEGVSLMEVLKQNGVISGIKVDTGTKPLPSSPEEKITKGLNGLEERYQEYYSLGARFAKWRAVIKIDEALGLPTDGCIAANTQALASYAKITQEAGLVPIIEPEVLMGGGHTIEVCYKVTESTLEKVFSELKKQNIDLGGILLKPNMVISGIDCPEQAKAEKVAQMTIDCFKEAIPAEVTGIVFLSGGQTEAQACENLNAINQMAANVPWELSFSYDRALQHSALRAWKGEDVNEGSAQQAFLKRAKLTSLARSGKYSPNME